MVLRAQWKSRAKCKNLKADQIDDLFFIEAGKKANKARQFCSNCPVKQECLNYAILYNEEGIWAGTTDDERKSLGMIREMLIQDAVANMTLETRNFRDWLSVELGQEVTEIVCIVTNDTDNLIDDADILDLIAPMFEDTQRFGTDD